MQVPPTAALVPHPVDEQGTGTAHRLTDPLASTHCPLPTKHRHTHRTHPYYTPLPRTLRDIFSGFSLLLGKSSSRWGAGSAKIPFAPTSKPKYVLRAVGGFLHAHTVEGEATKAASMCAKAPGGGIVCLLVKVRWCPIYTASPFLIHI